MTNPEIFSRRELNFPIASVYKAMSDPALLKNWWGPNGFTNTFHEFDLRVGGKWRYTMHGPEAGHYENEGIFKVVEPQKRVEWDRISQPHFYMSVIFEDLGENRSAIAFSMKFSDQKLYETILKFAPEKNEENFDRLETELSKMK